MFRLAPQSRLLIGTAGLVALLGASACSDDDTGLDAGTSDGGRVDAGAEGPDAGGAGECTLVEFDEIALDAARDVETIYSARLTTNIGAAVPDFLVFNFVNFNSRFGVMGAGTFSLSEPPNDNRGTCPDCISVFEDQVTPNAPPARVFFQSAGEIQLDVNPRTQVFRGRVAGLELIEVTLDGTLSSTPVPNGQCLRVADFEVDYTFVPATWTCDPALFNAGDFMCNCDCGAPDPDCFCDPFMDPNCPQEIPDDCPMGTTCTNQGCVSGCDPFADPVAGCPDGQLCVFDVAGPVCQPPEGRVNAAQLGQTCEGLDLLIEYCGIDGSNVPRGVCDDFDSVCKPICDTGDNQCTEAGEECFTFSGGGGPGNVMYGWCRAAGPVPPEEWICDPEEYGEGEFCHCNCGAVDFDCFNGEIDVPVLGCDEGETCTSGVCE